MGLKSVYFNICYYHIRMISVVDLFCGCGGFSEGARQEGANVILAVDMWDSALSIHEKNHPFTLHWCRNICEETFTNDMSSFLEKYRKDNPDIHVHIHASPPCTDLSRMGTRRNVEFGISVYAVTFELCNSLKQSGKIHTFSIENVHDKELKRRFNAITFDLSKYGVPQTRKRSLFLSEGINDLNEVHIPQTTIRNIIHHHYPEIDISKTRLRACVRKTGNNVYSGLQCTRSMDENCYTITCNPQRLIHVDTFKITYLNKPGVNAEIQTFPREYLWEGVLKKHAFTMIGNAVPPIFARNIIRNII